jgi:hypothetical protein
VKQQKYLLVLGQTSGNISHLLRRGLTSFERRFLKEFEESLAALVKTASFSSRNFLEINLSARMGISPYLPASMPHIEKLADLSVLLLPIFPLTSPGTIQGGLALSAVLELDIRRCYGATDDAALGHDSVGVD